MDGPAGRAARAAPFPASAMAGRPAGRTQGCHPPAPVTAVLPARENAPRGVTPVAQVTAV